MWWLRCEGAAERGASRRLHPQGRAAGARSLAAASCKLGGVKLVLGILEVLRDVGVVHFIFLLVGFRQ